MKTQAAQCAAMIRKMIKAEFPGVKAKVRSTSYRMGDSVTVDVQDLPPAIYKRLKARLTCFEYGKFDGMRDTYEITNSRDDIPQTKYLFINNRSSEELKNKILSFAAGYYADCEGLTSENRHTFRLANMGIYADQFLHMLFSGAQKGFWEFVAKQSALPSTCYLEG